MFSGKRTKMTTYHDYIIGTDIKGKFPTILSNHTFICRQPLPEKLENFSVEVDYLQLYDEDVENVSLTFLHPFGGITPFNLPLTKGVYQRTSGKGKQAFQNGDYFSLTLTDMKTREPYTGRFRARIIIFEK